MLVYLSLSYLQSPLADCPTWKFSTYLHPSLHLTIFRQSQENFLHSYLFCQVHDSYVACASTALLAINFHLEVERIIRTDNNNNNNNYDNSINERRDDVKMEIFYQELCKYQIQIWQ